MILRLISFRVFLCHRNGPQSDDDDSCSINSDPEAKVCMKIHNVVTINNLAVVSINLQGAECLLSFEIKCTLPLGTMWIDHVTFNSIKGICRFKASFSWVRKVWLILISYKPGNWILQLKILLSNCNKCPLVQLSVCVGEGSAFYHLWIASRSIQ